MGSRGQARRHRWAAKQRRLDRSVAPKPQPGTCGDADPLWLLDNTSLDQIETWLVELKLSLDAPAADGEALFSTWEHNFIKSVDEKYDVRHVKGFHDRPLSGKQLMTLKHLWKRLAKDAALIIERSQQ